MHKASTPDSLRLDLPDTQSFNAQKLSPTRKTPTSKLLKGSSGKADRSNSACEEMRSRSRRNPSVNSIKHPKIASIERMGSCIGIEKAVEAKDLFNFPSIVARTNYADGSHQAKAKSSPSRQAKPPVLFVAPEARLKISSNAASEEDNVYIDLNQERKSLCMRILSNLNTIRSLNSTRTTGDLNTRAILNGKLELDAADFRENYASQKYSDEKTGTDPVGFLRTGEDSLAFFVRNGASAAIKFIHLNRAPLCSRFRPYDLVVASTDEVEAEHFTMSSGGIIHIVPNSPSEFIPLADWMRESTLFNVITSISFFKHYLIRKMFREWIIWARYQIYASQLEKLKSQLFLAKKSFSQHLIQVKTSTADNILQSISLLDIKSQKTYDCASFLEIQAARRSEAMKQFEAFMDQVQSIIQGVCASVKGLSQEKIHHHARSAKRGQFTDKSSSLVFAKAEQSLRRRHLKQASEEATLIPRFICLVDIIVVESYVTLVTQSCMDFLLELKRTPRKAGLFETIIHFGEHNTTHFNPGRDQMERAVLSITDDIVSAVNSAPRLIFAPHLAVYLATVSFEAPNVSSIITSGVTFQSIRAELADRIQSDFSDAEDYVKIFESVRPIYEHDKSWDFEEYSQMTHTIAALKIDFLKISNWEKELEKMRAGQTVGVLHVDSKKLKNILMPSTCAKLDSMKSLVKRLARGRCKDKLQEYKQSVQTLLQRPNQLKDFAGHVERVRAIKLKQKNLAKNTNAIEELYRLLANYGVRIASEDMVQLDDLRGAYESLKTEADMADHYMNQKLEEMKQQLENSIQKLDEQVLQINAQLQIGVFHSAEHFENTDLIKSELDAIEVRLDQFEDSAKQFAEYQVLFGMTASKFLNLQASKDYLDYLKRFWNCVEAWNRLCDHIMHSPFEQLDVQEISDQIVVACGDAKQYQQRLRSGISGAFVDKTLHIQRMLPMISQLGSTVLSDRHRDKLFKILRQVWYPGMPFTLQQVIDFKTPNLGDIISEVHNIAMNESNLENALADMRSCWNQTEFVCTAYRDLENVIILADHEFLFSLVEEQKKKLEALENSPFASGVMELLERWRLSLNTFEEIFREWLLCQRRWIALYDFFASSYNQQRYVTMHEKFLSVNKGWTSLMLRTRLNPICAHCIIVFDGQQDDNFHGQLKIWNRLLSEIESSIGK